MSGYFQRVQHYVPSSLGPHFCLGVFRIERPWLVPLRTLHVRLHDTRLTTMIKMTSLVSFMSLSKYLTLYNKLYSTAFTSKITTIRIVITAIAAVNCCQLLLLSVLQPLLLLFLALLWLLLLLTLPSFNEPYRRVAAHGAMSLLRLWQPSRATASRKDSIQRVHMCGFALLASIVSESKLHTG